MTPISKLSLVIVLALCTNLAFGQQCETYLQQAEALFAQKKYEEAKKKYLNYKECEPQVPPSIDAKIAECDRLAQCEIHLQQAEALFAQKKYEEAKKKYLNYKECMPQVSPSIDAKIAECDRLMTDVPDVESIKRGMIRQYVQDRNDGYFSNNGSGRGNWSWRIEANDIKKIEIQKRENLGNAFSCDVRMFLQQGLRAEYIFDLQIVLVLNANNKWTVDHFSTKSISLVKTGRYEHCLNIEKTENRSARSSTSTGSYSGLSFTNTCNVSFVVCGQVRPAGGQWQKFYTYVSANASDLTIYCPHDEYVIDFVERSQ